MVVAASASCSTPTKMYAGDERPAHEVAVVRGAARPSSLTPLTDIRKLELE